MKKRLVWFFAALLFAFSGVIVRISQLIEDETLQTAQGQSSVTVTVMVTASLRGSDSVASPPFVPQDPNIIAVAAVKAMTRRSDRSNFMRFIVIFPFKFSGFARYETSCRFRILSAPDLAASAVFGVSLPTLQGRHSPRRTPSHGLRRNGFSRSPCGGERQSCSLCPVPASSRLCGGYRT